MVPGGNLEIIAKGLKIYIAAGKVSKIVAQPIVILDEVRVLQCTSNLLGGFQSCEVPSMQSVQISVVLRTFQDRVPIEKETSRSRSL